jgi:hypothetical protein
VDDRLRDLQRKAAVGGPEETRAYRAEILRTGKIDTALAVLVEAGFLTKTIAKSMRGWKFTEGKVLMTNLVVFGKETRQVQCPTAALLVVVTNGMKEPVEVTVLASPREVGSE